MTRTIPTSRQLDVAFVHIEVDSLGGENWVSATPTTSLHSVKSNFQREVDWVRYDQTPKPNKQSTRWRLP